MSSTKGASRGMQHNIDREMLSVTKYRFQVYFQYMYCVILVPHFSLEWPSVAFVFGEDLACELEIEDFLDTEGAIGWHTLSCCQYLR